jgi:beta-lactamase regulating signal transducer with metallopeptidase domain
VSYDWMHTEVFECSSAFWPWAAGLLLRTTLPLLGILMAGSLLGPRRAPLRHLMASLGLSSLVLLPALSLSVTWEPGAGPSLRVPWPTLSPAAASGPGALPVVLLTVWGLGAALLLAWLAADLLLVSYHARRRATHGTERWTRLARRLSRRLGIRRTVRVGESACFDIPHTWGTLRPVILLPRQARRWSDERLEAVLLHELGHVRRNDGLLAALTRAACAVYWFHPLAWWAQSRAREDAERACDRLVVEEGMAPARYARHLLAILREARAPIPSPAPTMARESQLARRITALVDRRPAAARLGRAAVGAILLAVVVPTFLLATVSVPGIPGAPSHLEGPVCSEAMPALELPEPLLDGPQSVEPEPFTPMQPF